MSEPPDDSPRPRRGATWDLDAYRTRAGGLDDAGPDAPDPSGSSPTEANRYELRSLLGRGGMGEVWLAWDGRLRRHVALKALHPDLFGASDFLVRFQAEAQATAQLQHPGIVPIHDVGWLSDGRPFYTMRVITGQDMAVLIDGLHTVSTRARWGPTESGVTFLDLCGVFQDVCEAVAWAHSRGVVHRDLKPANIMVGDFGKVQVVDWGLAKVLGSKVPTGPEITTERTASPALATRVGRVSGTPGYMAPEQAKGDNDQIGPPTDVFALGAILFTVLVGRAPEPGEDGATVLDALPRVPAELAVLCLEAMAADQPDRPASAGVLAERFGAWRVGAHEAADREQLAHAAESAFRALPLDRQVSLQSFLVRMVGPDGAPRPTSEKAAAPGDLQVLVDAGIVEHVGGDVSLADPGLLSTWSRLGGWVEADRHSHQQLHLLIEATRGWVSAGRPVALLWSEWGAVEHARHRLVAPTPAETDFLDASAARMSRNRLRERALAVGVVALVAVAAVFSTVQWRVALEAQNDEALARQSAEARALVSDSQRQILEGNPLAAAVNLQAAAARAIEPSVREAALLQAAELASAEGDSRVYAGHSVRLKDGVWSPRGDRIATGDLDGVVRVWSPETGETEHVLSLDEDIMRVVWSPLGDTLAGVSSSGLVRVWSADSGAVLADLEPDNSWHPPLRYLPDGRLVTATVAGDVHLVQPTSGRVLQTFEGHSHYVFDVDVSKDGRTLATASVDRTARLWDLETGAEQMRFEHPAQLMNVRLADGGRRLATSGVEDPVAWLWDTETGALVARLEGHLRDISTVEVSPDGDQLATSSVDGTTRIWRARDGALVAVLSASDTPAWSPDGQIIAIACDDGRVRIFDAKTTAYLGGLPRHAGANNYLSWSPTGDALLTVAMDGTARVSRPLSAQAQVDAGCGAGVNEWNMAPDERWMSLTLTSGGTCVVSLDGTKSPQLFPGSAVWSRWAPVGHRLLFGAHVAAATPVQVWSPGTAEPREVVDAVDPRTALEFGPTADEAYGVDPTYLLERIDLSTGAQLAVVDTGHQILGMTASGTRVLLLNHDHSREVWDVEQGRRLVRKPEIETVIESAVLGPEGEWVVWQHPLGSLQRVDLPRDPGVEPGVVWEVALRAPATLVSTDATGRWLAAATTALEVELFSARTGERVSTFRTSGPVDNMIFSASGDRIAVWNSEGGLSLRRTADAVALFQLGAGDAGGVLGAKPLASGALLTVSQDGVVRRWPILDDPLPVGALTNLRTCPQGGVVPVEPWPRVELIWAPRRACAETPVQSSASSF